MRFINALILSYAVSALALGGAEQGRAAADKGACGLLTAADVEAVQGDRLTDTKADEQTVGALAISRCLYQTANFNMSVSLEVVRKDPGHRGAGGPRQLWEERFGLPPSKPKRRAAQRVKGIGDEAFWTASRVSGALYVLKGDSYIRISVGGPGDEAAKIRKTKALAKKVLGRLRA